MSSKVTQDAMRRISAQIPDLKQTHLELIEDCLDECFEVGKAWDDIPILINEARQPVAAGLKS